MVVSEQWSLKAGGLLMQVVSNTGLTVYSPAILGTRFESVSVPQGSQESISSIKMAFNFSITMNMSLRQYYEMKWRLQQQ